MALSNRTGRTLLLTGASRGIGHATVKRFSAAGWRVITCSRHAFPENCPWEAGPEDHIQVDLADTANTGAAIEEIKRRLNGELHALVNNAAISPKAEGGKRLDSIATSQNDWHRVFQVNFFAPIMLARGLLRRAPGDEGLSGQRHLDRRLARASVRRRGLFDVEGGTRRAHPRDGARFRRRRRAGQCHRAGRNRYRRCCRPAPRRSWK